MRQWYGLGFSLTFALTSSPASSRPAELRPNVREACRQELAGAYLKVYDDLERNRTLIVQAKGALKDLEASLKKAVAEKAEAAKAAEGTNFSVEKSEKKQQAESRVAILSSQCDEYRTILNTSIAATPELAKKEQALKQELAKVFTFERLGDKEDGGYPIHLNYKTTCPKFKHLCSLPPAMRRDLLTIKIDDGTPEVCRRYGAIKNASE